MDMQLAGKNVLVTGSGQGIGRAIGLSFADEGANVAFHYRASMEGAVDAATRARETGVKAVSVGADISDLTQVKNLIDEVHSSLGAIDILVNNAAFCVTQRFLESNPADWKRQVDVTVIGMFNVTHAALPDLIACGKGAIVNILGDSGRVGESRAIVTSATRSSALGFTKGLAKEFGRSGVRANSVSLGLIKSPHTEDDLASVSEDVMKRIVRAYPLGRLGEMDDVPPLVVLMASPLTEWVTGQTVSIDGGYAMV